MHLKEPATHDTRSTRSRQPRMSLAATATAHLHKLSQDGQGTAKPHRTDMHRSSCSDSVVIISRWCEVAMRYEQGRVSHAVAGCMRSLLQDWHLMVTQLEHQLLTGHLTLQVSMSLFQHLFPVSWATCKAFHCTV